MSQVKLHNMASNSPFFYFAWNHTLTSLKRRTFTLEVIESLQLLAKNVEGLVLPSLRVRLLHAFPLTHSLAYCGCLRSRRVRANQCSDAAWRGVRSCSSQIEVSQDMKMENILLRIPSAPSI